jgi:excisionase family DNA binding protein
MDANQEQLKQKIESRKARKRAYYHLNKSKWKKYKESSKSKLTESEQEAIRERKREYSKAYYAKNRKKILARMVAYQQSRREQYAEYQAEWYQSNKKKIRERRKKYYHAVLKPRQQAAQAKSDFMTIRQAVDILKAKLPTFREWVYRGQIESVRTPGGRYLLSRETVIRIRDNIQHLPPEIRDCLGLTIQGGAE